MKKYLKRAAAILLTAAMISSLLPQAKASADNLPQYTLTVSKALDFNPGDAVVDNNQPLLYLTDMADKRVLAFNFVTGQSSYIQFNLQPEHIAIAEDQLYVTLISGPHNPQSSQIQPGAVAVIDTAAFNTQAPVAKEQFALDIEPYSITADDQGYIYISGATSGYGSELESYDPNTQKQVSSQLNCMTGKILFNSYNNVIYTTNSASNYPTSMHIDAYPVNNGIIGKKYGYEDQDTLVTNPDIMLSPDGKFLYTSSTEILTCSKDMAADLLRYKKLTPTNTFHGMAFNMDDRVFYGTYDIYDYDSLTKIGSYYTNHSVNKLFYGSNKLIALTADFTGTSYIETMDTAHIARPPVLVSTSIEDGEMNLPLLNDISLDFDQDINITNPHIAEIINNGQIDDTITTAAVQGNKLDISLNNVLKYGNEYTLIIQGGDITGKSTGIEYPEDIHVTFFIGSQDSISENVKHYMANDELINREKAYEGDLTVGLGNVIAVDTASTLTVNGDLIVYGEIVNYGTINVTGNIYINNRSELEPNNRQVIGNLYSTGNIAGNIVMNSYPKPFMTVDPDTDTTVNKNKQDFSIITYPGNSILLNGQIYNPKVGMYTDVPYQLRSGNNDIKIGVEDILSNINEKDININCTLPAPKIIEMTPDNLQSAPMPVNPKIVLKFDIPLDSFSTTDSFTLINNGTKTTQNIGAQVKNDENGISDELVISTGPCTLPPSSSFTLNIPYNSVISKDGVGLDKDYSITFSTDDGVKRLAGQDRYSTSVEISKEGWDTAINVVLATGDSFPDALCAAPLARKYDAPILLTNSKTLSPVVFDEIKRLKAQNIYIVGGTAAVSKDIEDTLTSSGFKCTRIQGGNRYETSAAIAYEVGDRGILIVATGQDFPDALSIAPLAAQMQAPILLADNSILPQNTKDFINKYKNIYGKDLRTIVVGGKGVIPDELLNSLPNAERFGGSNRYETNYKIISGIQGYNYYVITDYSHIFMATGANFPDALAGSALAEGLYSRIILVGKDMKLDNSDIRNFLKQYIGGARLKYVLGGTVAVPQDLVDKLINLN